MNILIVDDDKALCRSLQIQLCLAQHEVRCVYGAEEGVSGARAFSPELILLDLNLPDQSGLNALLCLLDLPCRPSVVMMTGEDDNNAAVEAMRRGAFDYLRKPLDMEDISAMVERVARHRSQKETMPEKRVSSFAGNYQMEMIGSHPKLIELHKKIGLLSRNRVTVLIQGESGTGKEMAAKILHEASTPDKPFVAINCSAVVPTLLESEFFGHEKGAFTGADRIKAGKLEHAKGGTIFLDEIGDMPLDLQGKLLRVLQEEEFVRVGGLESIPFTARVIAATHWDLHQLVNEGRFRKDLFYRLSVSSLYMPALRERRNDIPLLVDALLAKIATKMQCAMPTLTEDAMQKLLAYDWPGNVRELENVLTRAIALATDKVFTAEELQLFLPEQASPAASAEFVAVTLAEAEKTHLEKTLIALQWNITKSARQLAISPTTLRKKIADYGIENPFS